MNEVEKRMWRSLGGKFNPMLAVVAILGFDLLLVLGIFLIIHTGNTLAHKEESIAKLVEQHPPVIQLRGLPKPKVEVRDHPKGIRCEVWPNIEICASQYIRWSFN